VLTNARDLKDRTVAADLVAQAKTVLDQNHPACDRIVAKVEQDFLS
jgi:formiminotetrahydrofolate cyclodeaminase